MYITKTGQCWDEIAKEVYGDERYTGILMEANRDKLDIFIFQAGVRLLTPAIQQQQDSVPPWREI